MATSVEFSEVHRLTAWEYQELVDGGVLGDSRVELIDGLLLDMSPHSPGHAWVVGYLNEVLMDALERPSRQLRVALPLTIENSAPEPDFAVIARGTPGPYHPSTAELVIEVARTSLRRDLVVKPRIYGSAGVTEYWVIDVDDSRVFVHREPTPGGYRSRYELGPSDVLDGAVVGIGEIRIADVLAAGRPA